MQHGHIHISTPALLVITLAVIGVIWLITLSRRNKRRDAQAERDSQRIHQERMAQIDKGVRSDDTIGVYARATRGAAPAPSPSMPPQGYYPMPHAAPPMGSGGGTTIIHDRSGGSDMLTGLLIGDMIASEHSHPTYVEPAPSYQPEPSVVDNGSWDSGSSSGVDASWGGGDSSSIDIGGGSGGIDLGW